MSGKMNWGRSATRRKQEREPQGFGATAKDARSQSRADAAQAAYWSSLRRGQTHSIREAAEQSTRQRKVTVTLPKLKFLAEEIV